MQEENIHTCRLSPFHALVSGAFCTNTRKESIKMFKYFCLDCTNSRNGRIRRPTIVNGHIKGAILKGISIIRQNLDSQEKF